MAKKIMSAFIAVMLVICASAIPAFAADGPSAYVSISDKDGKLVLVLEKIDLSDAERRRYDHDKRRTVPCARS